MEGAGVSLYAIYAVYAVGVLPAAGLAGYVASKYGKLPEVDMPLGVVAAVFWPFLLAVALASLPVVGAFMIGQKIHRARSVQ